MDANHFLFFHRSKASVIHLRWPAMWIYLALSSTYWVSFSFLFFFLFSLQNKGYTIWDLLFMRYWLILPMYSYTVLVKRNSIYFQLMDRQAPDRRTMRYHFYDLLAAFIFVLYLLTFNLKIVSFVVMIWNEILLLTSLIFRFSL